MSSRQLHDETPWNTEHLLPRITQDAGMSEIQILLGGLSLLLSRVHPQFAQTNFLATRRVVMRLTRAVEHANPAKAHFTGADLEHTLQECGRALDPGTAMTLKNVLTQTLRREADAAHHDRDDDFTLSDFMAEQTLQSGAMPATLARRA